jgi:hypothetical protein
MKQKDIMLFINANRGHSTVKTLKKSGIPTPVQGAPALPPPM